MDRMDNMDKIPSNTGLDPDSVKPKMSSGHCVHSVHKVATLTLPVTTLRLAPRTTPDVARQLAVDSEALFIHFSRRLYIRLNKVLRPGYLAWTQSHEPELWARRESARVVWDDPAVYQDFKACKVSWASYRRLVHSWARVELACIRQHCKTV
ncbi:MAG: hypothetical protein HQK86_07365 [Nitrospinae bacterium]|nr:hypothetical protein [Nitrospinota bacterium]